MKHRASGLLFTILIFVTVFGVSNAATVTPPVKPAPQTGPTISTPPAATVIRPKGNVTIGGTVDRYNAPTANLTQIANSLRLRTRSLTTLITLPANLPVTQSVEVSISYNSTAARQRITQLYLRSTGNRFLYNDPEKDGKPRHMRIDVSLREPKPDGDFYTFAFTLQTDLDPLYDVQISPLRFTLLTDCSTFGNSTIDAYWWVPKGFRNGFHFVIPVGGARLLKEFAWFGPEVSARMLYRLPVFWFFSASIWDGSIFDPVAAPNPNLSGVNLIPGKTKTFKYLLHEGTDGVGPCDADIEYTISYTLRSYADL